MTFYLERDIEAIAESLGDIVDDFSGKTLLLGGGRGFLGRYMLAVFHRLNESRLAKPCKLIILDNLVTAGRAGAELPEMDHVVFLRHDVSRPLELDERLDFVVNAAGIASPRYYRTYPLETVEAAINGTRNLLDLARENAARFTFFSSSEIYGEPDPASIPTPETYHGNVACMGPRACYDESKRVGETLCYIYFEKYKVRTNAIRPFNVFGPGMQEADYRVLPNFASNIKAGRELQIYGSGRQTRTFCYVTDAVDGFLRVIARGVPGEAYNIGNPEPEIGIVDLVARIEEVLGRPVPRKMVDYPDTYPPDEPNRRCPDIRKAMEHLGYRPRVDLNEGLRRFLTWTDQAYTGEE